MVNNRHNFNMKKTILMGIAALMICGTVNATSWRVCSKPEAGANFLSVAAAVASNTVFSGDTLYLEPGHVERGGEIIIDKRLTIIGTGYYLIENNINAMSADASVFANSSTHLNAEGTNVFGCTFIHNLSINSNTHIVAGNCLMDGLNSSGQELTIRDNIIRNQLYSGYTTEASTIENNIIIGRLLTYYSYGAWGWSDYWINCTFRNNTIVAEVENDFVALGFSNCNIYNNIIINAHTGFSTTTDATTQTIDTTRYSTLAINAPASKGNTVQNNVLSTASNAEFYNCVFNKGVEDVLIWNNANNLEEKYKHIANGPAVGAGLNGTTCGAYGTVNGSREYQPAGIPQYRPYIYDANIDDTPTNNTINASFKIKVQQ